jgi:alkylation response protein AidB-like acyl-CoA dehydrogenase
MDFALTEDQKLVRDTVRQFMETELRPYLTQFEREERFPAEQIRRLGEMGFLGMLIPEEYGGSGADSVSYAIALEEMARICATTAVTVSVNTSVVCVPIYRHGTEAQKRKYLVPCARGEMLGAFSLTEPEAGSDSANIRTRAERHGSCYFLNGTKSWVTNAGVSGVYVIMAVTERGGGARGISAFLVEPGFPGFQISRYEDKMGLRMSHSAEIVLADCQTPVENRLGEEGQGLKIALDALDGGRVGIAAQCVGIAQGAFEGAVKHARHRKAFGKAIAEFQAIQWMLADMETEIQAGRMLTYQAAHMRDCGAARLGPYASRAKLYASEMANRVVAKAVQILGSSGYSRDSDVERKYRDARVTTIYEGTSEVQRMIIARDLLAASPSSGMVQGRGGQ